MVTKHDEAIYMVCRRCCSKTNKSTRCRIINNEIALKYKEVFQEDLVFDTPHHPKVLCSTCHRYLYSTESRKTPPKYEFTFHSTRNFFENCNQGNCEICNTAKANLSNIKVKGKKVIPNKKAPAGRPPTINNQCSPDYSLYKCCGARKGPGFHHNCNKTEATSNFQQVLKKRKIEQPLAAKVVREINEQGDVKLSNLKGKPTRIELNPSPEKPNHLSLEDVKTMKRKGGGVSNELLEDVLGVVRNSKTTTIKVPNMNHIKEDKQKLELDTLIRVDELELDLSSKKYQHKIENVKVVSIQDIPSLIKIWKPDLKEPYKVKLCGDHGQNFYKQTLHICSNQTKSNSSSDTMIVCAAEVPEQTTNLRKLYDLNWYKSLEPFKENLVITNDFKVTNQLLGIMLGKYPCPYCHWEHTEGFFIGPQVYRNKQNMQENLLKLQNEYGGNGKDNAKYCKGVFAPPILEFENTMDVLAPPELHLMEGAFHHIHLKLESSLTPENKKQLKNILKQRKIYPSKYHGGKYEGNEVRKILKNANEIYQNVIENQEQQKLVDTLVALNDVVHSCFAEELDQNFTSKIAIFMEKYQSTQLNVTLKVHVIARHVAEYLQKYSEPTKGLGYFSEQANESTHHTWKQYWKRYTVRMDSELYAPRIKLCLEDFIYNRLPL